jgi:hypothetical protein
LILGGGGLSSANSNFRDDLQNLHSAFDEAYVHYNNNVQVQSPAKKSENTGQMYNINISKDDAESIINLLRENITLKLSNGREIEIPRLNLDFLPSNFP